MMAMSIQRFSRPGRARRTTAALAVLWLTLAVTLTTAGQKPQEPSDPAAVERQVLEASREWFDALSAPDLEALDRLQTDDFLTVQQGPKGVAVIGKATQIESLRKSGDSRPKFERELSSVRVRAYGSVAVLTAVATFRRTGSDADGSVTQTVTTEIWVHEGGRWRLAHFQPAVVLSPSPAK
jgi:ketosteroid isomerase-like protein